LKKEGNRPRFLNKVRRRCSALREKYV